MSSVGIDDAIFGLKWGGGGIWVEEDGGDGSNRVTGGSEYKIFVWGGGSE